MTTLLHILWVLVPLLFFLLWLWAKLEEFGLKTKRSDVPDLFRQFVFITPCVIVTFLLDAFVLPGLKEALVPDFIPLGVLQVFLLPVVLYSASKIFGGSAQIRIERAPRPTETKRSGRNR